MQKNQGVGGTTNPKNNCNVRSTKVKRSHKKKRNRGGQPNNKNAVGYGAPYGNKNAVKHGCYKNPNQFLIGINPPDTPINRQVREYIEKNNMDRTIEVFNAVKKMLKHLKS